MAGIDKKVVILTGANSGIGLVASHIFCAQGGYDLILACRNETSGNETMASLKDRNPNCQVSFMKLDLSSLASVQQFVKDFKATGKKLHILINNAGRVAPKIREISEDGFEIAMATNHIGHFLLTKLLLDNIKQTATDVGEARIVIVASSAHDTQGVNKIPGASVTDLEMDNIQLDREGTYSTWQAYKNSKLANILHMAHLSRLLKDTNITVNAMCPGYIPRTGLFKESSACFRCFSRYCLDGLFKCCKVTRSPDAGGEDIFRLATSDKYKGVTGKFISSGKKTLPSAEGEDVDKQNALWEFSEKAVASKVPQ